MKKLLLALLLTTGLHSQTPSAKQVTLNYNETNSSIVVSIPKSITNVKQINDVVQVTVSKSYKVTIGRRTVNTYFKFTGYKYDSIDGFEYESKTSVIDLSTPTHYIFELVTSSPGEYIIEVCYIDSNKQTVTERNQSLIIEK